MSGVLLDNAPSKGLVAEAEEFLGKAVVSELRATEVEGIMEELRSYPYKITRGATKEFRGRLTTCFDELLEIPVLTDTQETLKPIPELLSLRVGRDREGVLAEYRRVGYVKFLSQVKISTIQGYAIWDWGAKEEQILPMEAFLRFLSSARLDKSVVEPRYAFLTPLHIAFAVLAPGAESSEFVAKAWSITKVMAREVAVNSSSVDEALKRWSGALTGLCYYEINAALAPLIGRRRVGCTFSFNSAAVAEERCEALINSFTVDEVKRRWLDEMGAAYLHILLGTHLFADYESALEDSLGKSSGDREWTVAQSGARALLESCPGHGEGGESSQGSPGLLPLEFLLALPTMDLSLLGEFSDLVEEYNAEWALASFDWSENK